MANDTMKNFGEAVANLLLIGTFILRDWGLCIGVIWATNTLFHGDTPLRFTSVLSVWMLLLFIRALLRKHKS